MNEVLIECQQLAEKLFGLERVPRTHVSYQPDVGQWAAFVRWSGGKEVWGSLEDTPLAASVALRTRLYEMGESSND
jgi:hypothetical protein